MLLRCTRPVVNGPSFFDYKITPAARRTILLHLPRKGRQDADIDAERRGHLFQHGIFWRTRAVLMMLSTVYKHFGFIFIKNQPAGKFLAGRVMYSIQVKNRLFRPDNSFAFDNRTCPASTCGRGALTFHRRQQRRPSMHMPRAGSYNQPHDRQVYRLPLSF